MRLQIVLVQIMIDVLLFIVPVHGQEASREEQPANRSTLETSTNPPWTPSSNVPATVTEIQVSTGQVELRLSAPVAFHPGSVRGGVRRPRYYVDLTPALLNRHLPAISEVADGPVQRVRLSQHHAGTVRVVLDLREPSAFRVTPLTGPYRLLIAPDAGAVGAGQPAGDLAQRTAQTAETPQQEITAEKSSVASSSSIEWSLQAARTLASDFTPFLTPEPVLLKSSPLHDALLPIPVVFSVDWPWERVCQDRRCVSSGEGRSEAQKTEARAAGVVQSALEQTTVNVEALHQESHSYPAEVVAQGAGQTNRGTVMRELWMIVAAVSVVLSFLAGCGFVLLWNFRRQGRSPEKSEGWEARMVYLEEAMQRAGALNSSFFHSLEISQKRLEALLTQADLAERNLRRLLHQAAFAGGTQPGRTDSYATAALLLSEGEEAQHVARTLKLPLAQVRLLQELQQHVQKEKPASQAEKSAGLQTGGAMSSLLDKVKNGVNGVGGSGIHIAQNGQQL